MSKTTDPVKAANLIASLQLLLTSNGMNAPLLDRHYILRGNYSPRTSMAIMAAELEIKPELDKVITDNNNVAHPRRSSDLQPRDLNSTYFGGFGTGTDAIGAIVDWAEKNGVNVGEAIEGSSEILIKMMTTPIEFLKYLNSIINSDELQKYLYFDEAARKVRVVPQSPLENLLTFSTKARREASMIVDKKRFYRNEIYYYGDINNFDPNHGHFEQMVWVAECLETLPAELAAKVLKEGNVAKSLETPRKIDYIMEHVNKRIIALSGTHVEIPSIAQRAIRMMQLKLLIKSDSPIAKLLESPVTLDNGQTVKVSEFLLPSKHSERNTTVRVCPAQQAGLAKSLARTIGIFYFKSPEISESSQHDFIQFADILRTVAQRLIVGKSQREIGVEIFGERGEDDTSKSPGKRVGEHFVSVIIDDLAILLNQDRRTYRALFSLGNLNEKKVLLETWLRSTKALNHRLQRYSAENPFLAEYADGSEHEILGVRIDEMLKNLGI